MGSEANGCIPIQSTQQYVGAVPIPNEMIAAGNHRDTGGRVSLFSSEQASVRIYSSGMGRLGQKPEDG